MDCGPLDRMVPNPHFGQACASSISYSALVPLVVRGAQCPYDFIEPKSSSTDLSGAQRCAPDMEKPVKCFA